MIDAIQSDNESSNRTILDANPQNMCKQESVLQGHMPLISMLSKRLSHSAQMREELMQSGIVGLLEAMRRYDESCQVKLITYAVPWILGEMRRVLRASVSNAATYGVSEWEETIGISAEKENLDLGIDVNRIALRMALEKLNQNERVLVYLRYFRDKTQKETAQLLGKSQSYVSKLEQRTLDALRIALG